jgi:hypothetical protein
MPDDFAAPAKAPKMLIADDDPAIVRLLADRCEKMGFNTIAPSPDIREPRPANPTIAGARSVRLRWRACAFATFRPPPAGTGGKSSNRIAIYAC